MRRKGMYKILSLVMAVVMMSSSWLAYLPTFAEEPIVYTIVEGEQIANDILLAESGTDLMLEGQLTGDYWSSYTRLRVHAQVPGSNKKKWIWVDFATISEVTYDRIAIPLTGTANLDEGQYTILVFNEDEDEITELESVILEVNLNSPPTGVAHLKGYNEVSEITRRVIDLSVLEDGGELLIKDVDGHTPILFSAIASNPAAGIVTIDGLKVLYDQASGYAGTFDITYILEDGLEHNLISEPYTITVIVADTISHIPVAVDDTTTTTVNVAKPINVLDNDSDIDGDSLYVVGVGTLDPTKGSVTFNTTSVTFTPAPDFFGNVTFTYTISDGDLEAMASVVVGVLLADGQPTNKLVNDTATVVEDTDVMINIYYNDVFFAGNVEVALSDPANGSVTFDTGMVLYKPDENFYGSDSFTYTVKDLYGETETATVNVTVTSVADPILATDDTMVIRFGSMGNINIGMNDLALEGGPMFTLFDVEMESDTLYIEGMYLYYKHDTNNNEPIQIKYVLTDAIGQTSVATVTVLIIDTNNMNSISLSDTGLTLGEGEFDNVDLLRKGYIAEDRTIVSTEILSGPGHGIATVNNEGIFTYHADDTWHSQVTWSGWHRTVDRDEVYVKVTLDNGAYDVVKVKVTVKKRDHLILVNDDRVVNEDSHSNSMLIFENDMIDEGIDSFGQFNFFIDQGPYHGTIEIVNRYVLFLGWIRDIKYTPDPNFNGVDEFRYYVRDKDDTFDVATVEVTVLSKVDYYSYANVVGFDIDKDETLQFNPLESAMGPIEFSSVDTPSVMELFGPVVNCEFNYEDLPFGVLTWNADGMITYDPGNQYAGVVTINFVMTNMYGDILTGQVSVDVGLFSDNVQIYLEDINGLMPNGTPVDGFFVQEGELFDLWQGVTYGRVSNTPLTKKGAMLYVIGEEGYLLDAEERFEIDLVDGEAYNLESDVLALNSYGKFMISYRAEDGAGHTGTSMPRLLTVNHQPEIGVMPITPGDPWHVAPTDNDPYDIDVYFLEENWSIMDEIYLYDFEEYDTNFLHPISELEVPEGFVLKFIHNEIEYDLSEFWTLFDIGKDEDPSDDLSITATISFVARDNLGGEGFSEDVSVRIMNHAPELTIVDTHVLLNENDPFTVMQGVTASDLEDNYLGLTTYPMITSEIEIMAIEGLWPTEAITEIDTSIAGMYWIHYTATDVMGATDMASRFVLVVERPDLMVEPMTLEIEPMGHFPVWNGVNVDFWSPGDLTWGSGGTSIQESHGTNIQFALEAYLGDPALNQKIDDLYQYEKDGLYKGTYEINYVATMREVDSEILRLSSDDIQWFNSITVATRTITVTDSSMGDVIYMNDFLPYGQYRTEPMDNIDDPIYMQSEYDIYPVLMAYNPGSDKERIVSAFSLDNIFLEGGGSNYMNQVGHMGFDDIAVTKDGKIYALLYNDVYWFDRSIGNFEFIFNIYSELEEAYGNEIPYDFDFQSMTVDEHNNLVIPTTYQGVIQAVSYDELDFEEALFYFNPIGFEYGNNDVGGGSVTSAQMVTRYLNGVGFVNYDKEMPFDSITDIAYSADLTKIYGIGGTYNNPNPEGASLEASMANENYYRLFSLVENKTYEPLADMYLTYPAYVEIRFFDVLSQQNLIYGFRYKGIATLDDDIFVTRFAASELNVGMNEDSVDMDYYKTDVLRYQFGDVNFEYQSDMDRINGIFMGATGAASTFNTRFELTPATNTMYVGYGRTAANGIVNFTSTLFPEVAFDSIIWAVVSEGNYVKNNGAGEFEAIAENITGSHTAEIQVSAVLKATGERVTREATILIYRSFQPVIFVPQEVIVIGVTLDTDAITLDYGDTADPEFTSYDFTETVTGTANTAVTWSLDDDTFVTVDENGLVTSKEDIPLDTGDITVELTVRTVIGGATATATIIFEEQAPLGAIEFFEPYVTGYPNGRFEPERFVSRAEVAMMFSNFLKLEPSLDEQAFTDVAEGHWAYDSVQAMFEVGIFKGYKKGSEMDKLYFDPDAPIKRSEIAQVFTNYWGYLGISVAGQSSVVIDDVDDTYWAFEAINRVYNTGLFAGFEDDTFRPENPTLRVQLVSMINKLLERPQLEAETNSFSDVLSNHPFYGDIEAASQTFLKPQGE